MSTESAMDFIKKYKTKMSNSKKTLDIPVEIMSVYSQITDSYLKETFKELLPYRELYFWDFGVRQTRKFNVGTKIVIICGPDRYHVELIKIINDSNGVIGDIFGWSRQFGAPWKNVCALKKCILKTV